MSSDPDSQLICDIFFELSNESRLDIIVLLEQNAMKLSQIAKELDLPVQEVSRQLARLVKVKIITKNLEGAYIVTPQGRNILRLLPSFQFLSDNSVYFEKHCLDKLPLQFMNRIGELRNSSPVSVLMESFVSVERVVQESDEFFYYITNQNLVSPQAYALGAAALDRGVVFKCIELANYAPPEALTKKVSEEVRDKFTEHRKNGLVLDRELQDIDVIFYMNEKEVGLLAFPLMDGSMDYLGFTSKDKDFIKWCKDLHEYYWGLGEMKEKFYIAYN